METIHHLGKERKFTFGQKDMNEIHNGVFSEIEKIDLVRIT